MSLSSAISTAQTIFSNTGLQSSALSTNIANASNPDYARRVGILTIDSTGSQKLVIQRTTDNGLVKQTMYATADSSAQDAINRKLVDIRSLLGGNDYETAPSTYIAKLRDNLQAYATKPNESTLAQTVISSAQDVSNSLNSVSGQIQGIRGEIDEEIKDQISQLENLLKQFKTVNDDIKAGSAVSADVNNELDMRERYLKQISEIVGVRYISRANNDMVLYTSDGTTLFDVTPREIRFTPNAAYDASTEGKLLYIDGVEMAAGENGNTTAKGSLQALLQVRDDVIPTFQKQLDETARGLIELFRQTDKQSSPTEPDIPGLFTWGDYAGGGLPAWDADGKTTIGDTTDDIIGLASKIKVNDALVKNRGGIPTQLRDGGYAVDTVDAANVAYKGNTNNDASYSALLDGLVGDLDDDLTFDPTAMLDTSVTIAGYATASVGWLEQLIQESANAQENKTAQLDRVKEALSNKTGVSLDEEMSLMLDLEQSYKASSRLVSAVDEMIQSLLSAVR